MNEVGFPVLDIFVIVGLPVDIYEIWFLTDCRFDLRSGTVMVLDRGVIAGSPGTITSVGFPVLVLDWFISP